MTEDEMVALMKTSTSEAEWDANCDKVKAAFGGNYPPFWWSAMKLSGVMEEVLNSFGSTSALQITVFEPPGDG